MARILVVDDEESMRVALGEVLVSHGYKVDGAADVADALRLIETYAYDVVLCDIVMPDESGMALLAQITKADVHPQVVMITGEPTIETAAAAVRAGAADYLTKPVPRAAILRAVKHAVQIKQLEHSRWQLQQENQQYQKQLEALVQARTQALDESNRQLFQTLEQLKRVQQQEIQRERLNALGQMVSGIAHDFNNLLMPILGLSDFLISDPETLADRTETLNILANIRSAAEDARSIVRRLREFYKPDEELEVQPVDLRALIEQIATITEPAWKIQSRAEGREILLKQELDDVPIASVNESQIREVLMNLILNAVDAMPAGGQLGLSLRSDAEWICIEVSDTGTGMPEEVQQRCFEPFFSTKGERGSGLGLSMCHGIVARHQGRIRITSQVGVGTTFSVQLPLRDRVQAPIAERPAQAVPKGLRVLVMDDEAWSADLVSRCLVQDGHTVITANSGLAGLERFRAEPFDLVFTDRAMPGMGGDEVARQIKQRAPHVPVIMLTGFGDLLQHTGKQLDGVDVILSKPVTRHDLRRAIGNVIHATSPKGS